MKALLRPICWFKGHDVKWHEWIGFVAENAPKPASTYCARCTKEAPPELAWRRRKLRSLFREGVVPEMTWRHYFWAIVLRKKGTWRFIKTQWKLGMPMPGDRFEDFQIAEIYEVIEAKPGRPMRCLRWDYAVWHGEWPPPGEPTEVLVYRSHPDVPGVYDRTRIRSNWQAI